MKHSFPFGRSFRIPLVAFGLFVGLTAAATSSHAGLIVLKDGRAIRTKGGYLLERNQVIFYLEDGSYVSLKRAEVDLEHTAEANRTMERISETTADASSDNSQNQAEHAGKHDDQPGGAP